MVPQCAQLGMEPSLAVSISYKLVKSQFNKSYISYFIIFINNITICQSTWSTFLCQTAVFFFLGFIFFNVSAHFQKCQTFLWKSSLVEVRTLRYLYLAQQHGIPAKWIVLDLILKPLKGALFTEWNTWDTNTNEIWLCIRKKQQIIQIYTWAWTSISHFEAHN